MCQGIGHSLSCPSPGEDTPALPAPKRAQNPVEASQFEGYIFYFLFSTQDDTQPIDPPPGDLTTPSPQVAQPAVVTPEKAGVNEAHCMRHSVLEL